MTDECSSSEEKPPSEVQPSASMNILPWAHNEAQQPIAGDISQSYREYLEHLLIGQRIDQETKDADNAID